MPVTMPTCFGPAGVSRAVRRRAPASASAARAAWLPVSQLPQQLQVLDVVLREDLLALVPAGALVVAAVGQPSRTALAPPVCALTVRPAAAGALSSTRGRSTRLSPRGTSHFFMFTAPSLDPSASLQHLRHRIGLQPLRQRARPWRAKASTLPFVRSDPRANAPSACRTRRACRR